MSLKAVKENGKDYLQISAPGYRALLDPGAAGVLPIAVGRATRLSAVSAFASLKKKWG